MKVLEVKSITHLSFQNLNVSHFQYILYLSYPVSLLTLYKCRIALEKTSSRSSSSPTTRTTRKWWVTFGWVDNLTFFLLFATFLRTKTNTVAQEVRRPLLLTTSRCATMSLPPRFISCFIWPSCALQSRRPRSWSPNLTLNSWPFSLQSRV